MDKDALKRRLMTTFVGELEEHIQSLDRNLLALERGSEPADRAEIFNTLFRTAHSLKGAARSVDVGVLEAFGHRIESIFAEARSGKIELDGDTYRILFAAVDSVKDVARRLSAGDELEAGSAGALLSSLETVSGTAIRDRQSGSAAAPSGAREDVHANPSEPRSEPVPPMAIVPATNRTEFVRVSATKLDTLLALGGELLVARRRAELRRADIARLVDMAKRWETEWRRSGTTRHAFRLRNGKGNVAVHAAEPTIEVPAQLVEHAASNLAWFRRQLDALADGLATDYNALDQVAAPLETELVRVRMVPFAAACEGLERTVRDLALATRKQVDVTIEGGGIEIDRSIIEGIKDPLLHLVRNAVDHGIELPEARVAVSKTPRGRITLSARLRNGRVEILVADDGRGLDVAAIRAQASNQNLPVPEIDRDAIQLVFAPGLSTSSVVTEISGRGVGLDVVKTAIEARRGGVEIFSEPGAGSKVVITVPLSLTRIPVLLATAGGKTYAFESATIRGLRRVAPNDLRTMEGRDVLVLESGPVPVRSLADVLDRNVHETLRPGTHVPVVVLGSGSDQAAFVVDELLAEQVVVVKDLGPRLRRVRNVIGATVLATGQVALILNSADLVRLALGHAPTRALSEALAERPAELVKRLLVVDDFVTTRTLVKSILEAAGYEVAVAADGMEAWSILQEKGADLVVSDVEMPRMDGFSLTEAIRGSKRFRDVPVILVTALETERDRMRGLDLGADAYLPKSAFDQADLLRTIGQLL